MFNSDTCVENVKQRLSWLDQSIVLNVVVLLILCSWESFVVPSTACSVDSNSECQPSHVGPSQSADLCFVLVLAESDNQLTVAFNAETGSTHFSEPEQMEEADTPLTA